jgi:hypothetical protein
MKINFSLFRLKDINRYKAWIWLLFFSFAYEKPIFIISSLDKANPRLFDLILLIGVLLTFKKKVSCKNPVFRQWALIIFWFTIVVLLGAVFYPFPWNVKQFMFYFLFEYYKGLLAIWIFLSIPKKYYSLETIMHALIVGGIFVAAYCVYELNTGISEVIIAGDKTLGKPPNVVWGPYIGSYFEISVFIPMAFSIAFVLTLYSKGKKKFLMTIVTLFISWPVLFTGSRTAIFLFLLTFSIIVLMSLKRSIFTLLVLAVLFAGTAAVTNKLDLFFNLDQNEALERMISLEKGDHHNSILNRLLSVTTYSFEGYDQEESVPAIGAGFYVAPINGRYRVGYGVHNIYFFPAEQSGLIGSILFFMFIYVSIKILRKGLKELDKNSLSYWFVVAVYAYFIASLLIGISSHTFWRGFTTYNFNTLRILLLVAASIVIIDSRKLHRGITK